MAPDEVRRQRKRLGLTQVELAARIGVHPITLSRWERGENPIPEPAARLIRLLEPAARRRPTKRRRGAKG